MSTGRKPPRPAQVSPPSGPPPSLVFLLPLLASAGLDKLIPWRIPGGHYLQLGGFAAVLAALFLMYSASSTQRSHQTTTVAWRQADRLVTTGPYGFSRNPAYVADVLWYLGGTGLIASWWTLVLLPFVLVAFHHLVIRKEEAYLAARFPAEWPAYTAKVRRWL